MNMNRNDSYEYENEELDEESEARKRKIIKGIFFVILLVVVGIVVLLLVKGCENKEIDRYDELVKAAKEYYENEKDELPQLYGEQVTITLKDLKDNKLIENVDAFSDCTDASTYVKVSKLESGKYQYTPVLNCTEEETAFGSCVVGDEDDLEENSSNVEYAFIAYRLQRGIKEYYPSKKTDDSEVKEYYKTAPSAEYNLTDDEGVTGYKYYKTIPGGKVMWNNGAYSETAPAGYTTKGASKQITYYRTRTVAKYLFRCVDDRFTQAILSPTYCPYREQVYGATTHLTVDPNLKESMGLVTSCDGKTIVNKETPCTEWSEWTTTVCEEGDDYRSTGKRCESKTVTAYQWSKESSSYNLYYPSNKTDAYAENTYYVDTPAAGYVRDDSSATKVYRFYKFTILENGTNKNAIEEWIKINDRGVSKDEMFESLEELKYEVETLEDIEENEDLKYEVVLKYCNRK